MPPLTAASSRQDDPGPADLLWRHRFQKQHAQLLERMQALERRDTVYDQRTLQAQQTSATCNATTAAVEQLCKRFEAIEEDEEQQRQNELVSKILDEQGRELAVLRDEIKTYEGLQLKLRDSEEHVKELRKILGQCSNTIRELERKIVTLEKKENADFLRYEDVVRSSMARIKLLETREDTKEKQLSDLMGRLVAVETEYRSKQDEMKRSIEGLMSDKHIRSIATPAESDRRVPSSPEVGRASHKAIRPPVGPVPRDTHLANSSRVVFPGQNQQNARVLPTIPGKQSSTQATTQLDETERLATNSTLGDDELAQPVQIHRTGPAPKKKAKLNNTKPSQPKSSVQKDGPKKLQRSPQKIVVLRYAPSPDSITAAPQDERRNERSTKRPKQKQGATKRSDPRKPFQNVNEPTQTQGQTTQFLRRSARHKGNDASDTQHVELGRSGDLCVLPSNRRKASGVSKPDGHQPKAVSKTPGANPPPPAVNAKQTKASAGPKAAAALSKPNALASRSPALVLKKRKRPKLDDLEWI